MGTVVVLLLVATCLGMGIKLRTDSLPYHQNLWGIDWLVYYEEQGRALRHGNLVGWLLQWEGLHPPLSGVIHGFLQVLSVGWHVHWAATVSAGLLAALLLGLEGWRRASAVAPLILLACHSLSPLQANYGLNTSPYPWVLLLVGLSTVLLLRAVESDDRRLWWAAAIASALAAQVHVLALAAVGVQAIFVLLRRGWKRDQLGWLLLVCLSAAFLVVVSLLKAGDEWTFHISEEQPWIVSLRHVATSRFGELGPRLPLAVLLGLGIVGGLATRARAEVGLLLAQCLAMLAALAFFMEIHVADPRLTHYYTTPHLLFVAAGSWGLAHLGRRWGWRGSLAVLLLAAATAWPSIS